MFKRLFLVGCRHFRGQSSMSKSKKGKTAVKSEATENVDAFPAITDKCNNILINILAKPGAKQNCITDITPEGVSVQINAPPAEGEANAELVKYISSLLDIRKGDVCLHKGFKSRQKTIRVEAGSATVEEIKRKIKGELLKN